MKPLFLVPLALLLLAAILAAALKKRPKALDRPWPLEVRRPVLSPSEQVLYRRLVQSLPQYLIFAQVQLSRFLDVRHGVPRQGWLNRINQLSIDFLVLDPAAQVVAAIELDDASHNSPHRKAADARKSHALQSAGVRLIRWQVQRLPDETEIKAALGRAAENLRSRRGG